MTFILNVILIDLMWKQCEKFTKNHGNEVPQFRKIFGEYCQDAYGQGFSPFWQKLQIMSGKY